MDTLERMQDIAEKVAEKEEVEADSDTEESRSKIIAKIMQDGEFASEVATLAQPVTLVSGIEREKKTNLLIQQSQVKMVDSSGKERTFEEVASSSKDIPSGMDFIDKEFVDPDMKNSRFSAISKEYYKSGMADRDMVRVLKSLNDNPDSPFFVTNIERRDISDSLNCKEEIVVTVKGLKSRSVKIKIEVPKMTRDGYFYLNGSKRILSKQIIALPVIKFKPDQVLVSTPYNKCIVSRYGRSLTLDTNRLRKFLKDMEGMTDNVIVNKGEIPVHKGVVESLEHEDAGREILDVRITNPDTKKVVFIDFHTRHLEEQLEKFGSGWITKEMESGNGYPIGYRTEIKGGSIEMIYMTTSSGNVRSVSRDGEVVDMGRLDEFVYSVMKGNGIKIPEDVSTSPTKHSFTRVKALDQQYPLVVFLGYRRGLVPLLEIAGADPQWITQPDLRKQLKKYKKDFLRFSDGVLMFNAERISISLLVNGLKQIDTREYSIGDTVPEGDIWLDYFRTSTRLSNIRITGLDIFRNSFIDPITVDILEDLGIPSDFDGLFLYANSLLETNEHMKPNDFKGYRIRGPEMLNALLYKIIHREMESLSRKRDVVGTHRLNVPADELIRQFQQANNVEEISELNPLLEAEMLGKVTWGWTRLVEWVMQGSSTRRQDHSINPLLEYSGCILRIPTRLVSIVLSATSRTSIHCVD